ncbi:hypothetical protein [Shimia ponticola]|uniref:hypothetical protein n=1 Tax=Shimia ponticola TaxID=2582893 RepID=UPI0011BEE412|nr:hypothetical protein [Shimia ponticola]
MTDKQDPFKSELTDDHLESAFAALRGQEVKPSNALLARIMADAEEVTRDRAAHETSAAIPDRKGLRIWVRQIMASLGGAPGAVGLAAMACLGVGIGLNPPAVIEALETTYFGVSDVYVLEMIPDLQGELIDG